MIRPKCLNKFHLVRYNFLSFQLVRHKNAQQSKNQLTILSFSFNFSGIKKVPGDTEEDYSI